MTKTNMLYIIILLSDDISISANITSGGSSIVTKFEPYEHMTCFDGHRGRVGVEHTYFFKNSFLTFDDVGVFWAHVRLPVQTNISRRMINLILCIIFLKFC